MHGSSSESGNILFLILIAVALFAALSYAIAWSGRGSSKGISEEQAQTVASALLNQAVAVQTAYQRVRVACEVEEIDFAPLVGANPNAPTDGSCRVFDQRWGLGREHLTAPPEVLVDGAPSPRWSVSPYLRIIGVGSDDGTAPCTGCELSLVLPYVNETVCRAYNRLSIGVDTLETWIASNLDYSASWRPYAGEFGSWDTAQRPVSRGHPVQCVAESNGNTGIYGLVYVLEAR